MPIQFSPPRFRRLIPGLAVLALLALFIHLGQWQSEKAESGLERRALHASRTSAPPLHIGSQLVDAGALEFARVSVRGEYEPERQFYLDNQIDAGRPGVHVITPLKIQGGETRILVSRGWLGWPDRQVPPAAMPPSVGLQVLTGLAAAPTVPAYLLMPERAENFGEVRHAIDVARFARESGQAVQPVALYLDHQAGLLPFQPRPTDKVEMHRSYALQWYGLAVALALFYAIAAFRKTPRKQTEPKADCRGEA